AEAARERRTVEQRTLSLAEAHPVRGIGNGQDRRVTPQPWAVEGRRPGPAQRLQIVLELEQSVTALALEPVAERVALAAIDAGQRGGERADHARFPKRWSITNSITSSRCRSVCSFSARRCAFTPISRASSACAR